MSDNESIQAEQDGTEPSSEKTAVPPMAPLPCPFCGSPGPAICENYVMCWECLATGPEVKWDESLQGDEFSTEAVKRWNARAEGSNVSEEARRPTS